MGWLEIGGALGIFATLIGLLRWRRSVRAGRNFPPSSPYSQHTEARPTLPALDPDRAAHQSPCRKCGARLMVLLAESRLESRPWRLIWRCRACGGMSRVRVHADALEVLLALDRAGGMPLSVRELERFAGASHVEWETALRDEVL